MSDTKILQAILDGQTLIRKDIKEVKEGLKKTEERLTGRMDKLGLQIARLEDDAPTIEEVGNLEKRVSKLEDLAPKN
ncbi:MAG: hypothetical protein US96_C0032G0008 [Candidatus Woesebacteria bacterium GW2011_GWB1_38_5b]|uniref:Uncharacterized protein n=1 Tax=Candidatus Woesebacteria bacterium GW2011_GWB1_38_5b TaxID=1618569 RepID=A0A0G0ML16_9BACT|nr:MAG: hypothetical protein US96_C0032G0008 [Candidatus Woesebacteria bacterium GW2011_GWB1_38_5b]